MPSKRKDMRLYEELETEEAFLEEDDLDSGERHSDGSRPRGWRSLDDEGVGEVALAEEGWDTGKLESFESLKEEEDQDRDWDE